MMTMMQLISRGHQARRDKHRHAYRGQTFPKTVLDVLSTHDYSCSFLRVRGRGESRRRCLMEYLAGGGDSN